MLVVVLDWFLIGVLQFLCFTVSMHEYLVFKFSMCWCSWFILEIRQYLPAWLMHSGFKLLGLSSSLHGGNSVSLHDWLALTLHD
jgi:hypothetical protein